MQSDAAIPSRATVAPWRDVAVCLGLAGLALLNWRHPVLRTSNAWVNEALLTLALLLPAVAAVIIARKARGRSRRLAMLALTPTVVAATSMACLIAWDLGTTGPAAPDRSLEPLQTIQLAHSRAVLYRTNCGATCDYGVLLRQELPLMPGLLLVRERWRRYHRETASLAAASPYTVVVDGEYIVAPAFVYF